MKAILAGCGLSVVVLVLFAASGTVEYGTGPVFHLGDTEAASLLPPSGSGRPDEGARTGSRGPTARWGASLFGSGGRDRGAPSEGPSVSGENAFRETVPVAPSSGLTDPPLPSDFCPAAARADEEMIDGEALPVLRPVLLGSSGALSQVSVASRSLAALHSVAIASDEPRTLYFDGQPAGTVQGDSVGVAQYDTPGPGVVALNPQPSPPGVIQPGPAPVAGDCLLIRAEPGSWFGDPWRGYRAHEWLGYLQEGETPAPAWPESGRWSYRVVYIGETRVVVDDFGVVER